MQPKKRNICDEEKKHLLLTCSEKKYKQQMQKK